LGVGRAPLSRHGRHDLPRRDHRGSDRRLRAPGRAAARRPARYAPHALVPADGVGVRRRVGLLRLLPRVSRRPPAPPAAGGGRRRRARGAGGRHGAPPAHRAMECRVSAIWICFFASGAAALALEMLWMRSAALVLGGTATTNALVLACY